MLTTSVDSQVVIRKTPYDLMDRNNSYWVMKVNQMVARPSFPANISFRTFNGPVVYNIDCSTSSNVLYINDEIIFLTSYNWTIGVTYYVMLDEGVLFATRCQNSSTHQTYDFWPVRVVVPSNG
ncbi:unnamed protein product [Adineta ricciae]|nr:unnamed protein product [Adineta ricciae]